MKARLIANAFHMKTSFVCILIKLNFHKKNFTLAFIIRFKETVSWSFLLADRWRSPEPSIKANETKNDPSNFCCNHNPSDRSIQQRNLLKNGPFLVSQSVVSPIVARTVFRKLYCPCVAKLRWRVSHGVIYANIKWNLKLSVSRGFL